MVEAAERDQVLELRFPAVRPVLDVVTVAEARAIAAGETAAAVARFERAADRRRECCASCGRCRAARRPRLRRYRRPSSRRRAGGPYRARAPGRPRARIDAAHPSLRLVAPRGQPDRCARRLERGRRSIPHPSRRRGARGTARRCGAAHRHAAHSRRSAAEFPRKHRPACGAAPAALRRPSRAPCERPRRSPAASERSRRTHRRCRKSRKRFVARAAAARASPRRAAAST